MSRSSIDQQLSLEARRFQIIKNLTERQSFSLQSICISVILILIDGRKWSDVSEWKRFGKRSPARVLNILINMQLIRKQSYLPPEGDYTGTIVETRIHRDSRNGQTRECLRHTLVCDDDDMFTEYRARVDYWSSQINDFARDAEAILGDQCRELIDSEHNIIESKLDLFVGKRVQFTVVHEYRPGHKDAFRKVINLKPRKLVEPKPRFPITPLKDRLAA